MKSSSSTPLPLWNDPANSLLLHPSQDAYLTAVLEQWKMCVETTERVSTRRAFANTFFLTLNSAALATVGYFWGKWPQGVDTIGLLLPLVALLARCVVWWILVRSYRQLNEAKFVIVHELESRLPARVFAREWALLRPDRTAGRYLRLTSLEQAVPILFALIYLGAFALAVSTAS
jgi:hypothetical protein